MMPLAMLLLFLQLKLVDCLFVDVPEHAPDMTFHRSISGKTINVGHSRAGENPVGA
jgi:hypothetical protein